MQISSSLAQSVVVEAENSAWKLTATAETKRTVSSFASGHILTTSLPTGRSLQDTGSNFWFQFSTVSKIALSFQSLNVCDQLGITHIATRCFVRIAMWTRHTWPKEICPSGSARTLYLFQVQLSCRRRQRPVGPCSSSCLFRAQPSCCPLSS